MKQRKNRRKLRNFIVNKKQLFVVVFGTVYIFLSLAVVLTIIIAPVYADIFQTSEVALQRESAKDFILVSEKLVIALSAIFAFAMAPLIWLTHRFFGPLINFAKIFKKVSAGDLTARVYLRRGDLLQGEADLANEMIKSMRQTISDVKKQHHQLVEALDGIVDQQSVGDGLNGDLLEAQKQAMACEKLLEKLKTDEVRDKTQP